MAKKNKHQPKNKLALLNNLIFYFLRLMHTWDNRLESVSTLNLSGSNRFVVGSKNVARANNLSLATYANRDTIPSWSLESTRLEDGSRVGSKSKLAEKLMTNKNNKKLKRKEKN